MNSPAVVTLTNMQMHTSYYFELLVYLTRQFIMEVVTTLVSPIYIFFRSRDEKQQINAAFTCAWQFFTEYMDGTGPFMLDL